jgi:hypothetical protein
MGGVEPPTFGFMRSISGILKSLGQVAQSYRLVALAGIIERVH